MTTVKTLISTTRDVFDSIGNDQKGSFVYQQRNINQI